jgi:hypothetical protein
MATPLTNLTLAALLTEELIDFAADSLTLFTMQLSVLQSAVSIK